MIRCHHGLLKACIGPWWLGFLSTFPPRKKGLRRFPLRILACRHEPQPLEVLDVPLAGTGSKLKGALQSWLGNLSSPNEHTLMGIPISDMSEVTPSARTAQIVVKPTSLGLISECDECGDPTKGEMYLVKLARDLTGPGPSKRYSFLEGKWDPENFRRNLGWWNILPIG